MSHITAKARVDGKTKHLALRIERGEIAVIDHQDLDSTCARMLLACHVGAVVNASPSISKRYPNTGPRILVDAGIPIIDNVGKEIMTSVIEGDELRIDGNAIWRGGAMLASGLRLTQSVIARLMEESRENLSEEIAKFAQNTLMFVQQEKSLILDPIDVPSLKTNIFGRHALIVVRGERFREDLGIIRSYVQDMKPVLIGVDGVPMP